MSHASASHPSGLPGPVAVVGAGRMGRALVAALAAADIEVDGPLPRGATGEGAAVVLLAVPDASIADAARLVREGPLVGHLSGARGLDELAPHAGFSIHPLMTVTRHGAEFTGASAAIEASDERGEAAARALARALGMVPFRVAADDRVAYHAAASITSNFFVTLEEVAARLAATAGVPRDALVPLVRATLDNWGQLGADALTGPIARGDAETVARQRAAVAERLPQSLALFDALAAATADLAAHPQESRT